MKSSDEMQLELIRESIFKPEAELEAKKLLLDQIYREVVPAYRPRALNGGGLASLPGCVSRDVCEDDLGFTYNALRVLMARYMVRDARGRFMETPSMVMARVAMGFAPRLGEAYRELYRMLVEGRFVFNSPTLFNMFADGARGTLSACYVTPVYDSMEAIMDAAVVQAMTFKWGGGQGFSFSELRPRWDYVRGTSGRSSGPMSFMRLYDTVTELVKQGGKRRGANMGIMHAWHPDIITPGFDPAVALRNALPPQVQGLIDALARLADELREEGYELPRELVELARSLSRSGWWTVEDAGFIQAKKPPLQDFNLTNFNISVGANDAFMKAVLEGRDWWMINPRYTEDPETGVYRIHYSVSRETGLGGLGRLLEEAPWLLESPYLNIYEDLLEEALHKALEAVAGEGLDPSQKNVHAWRYPAREIWRELVEAAWGGGDPGMVYLDNHNKWNPTPWLGVVTATNPCVSGDTRVLTPEGWKPAREVWEEAKRRGEKDGKIAAVLADGGVLGEGGEPVAYETELVAPGADVAVYRTIYGDELKLKYAKATKAWVWHVGRKKGLKVVTKEGYEITVTEEHKFLTPEGWKEARELKPGDKIMVARLTPESAAKALTRAVKLDPDIAFALGWLVGDGTLSKYYVAWYFGPQDSEAMERVMKAIKKLGGNPQAHIIKRGNEVTIQFNSATGVYERVKTLMKGLMGKQGERRLPEIAWRMHPESLREFLRGLFTADGTVDADKAVRLASISRELLRDVQQLLVVYGIGSVIYERRRESEFRYVTKSGEEKVYKPNPVYYELVIKGYSRRFFAELIGFESREKRGKLRLAKLKRDTIWATVETVKEVESDFYDFTVPGIHAYIAGGLVNHNCSEQPLYQFESCNLGSISVDKYVRDGVFDLDAFYRDVVLAFDSLDAVIDLNRHPDPRQDRANRFTRKVGLGIMGLAEALAALRLPYDSEEAVAFTLAVMAALEAFAWKRSWELGARLGHAPAFECRRWDWRRLECLERGEPEELARLHTPALVKAGEVMWFEGGWLKVRYHQVELPGWALGKLNGRLDARFEPDGSVRLVRLEALERVLEKVFGVTGETLREALAMGVEAVESPRHLLALAVYRPLEAWRRLVEYGRRLGARAPRNTVATTIAPTGTISIIAGTSSGIEPYFALVYLRQVAVGTFLEVVRRFRDDLLELARRHGVGRDVVEAVYEEVRRSKGSLRRALQRIAERLGGRAPPGFLEGLAGLARLYPTSMDFPLWYHLAHQAVAQLYVDQAISKTVNLPREASVEDVEALYLAAWLTGLKGFTVYRDESKGRQVIVFGATEAGRETRLLRKRRGARMALPRKKLARAEAERDPRLRELFKAEEKSEGEEVVVELTQNSECKTCEL